MRIEQRAFAYSVAFPQYSASHLNVVRESGRDVLYGRWVLGNDYRSRTSYYGAYPPGYLSRVLSLFPDVEAKDMLHVFSGALPRGEYARCDMQHPVEYECDVLDLPRLAGRTWRVVFADPPYSSADAERYGTKMINRGKVLRALADVTEPGWFLVWLDVVWPMHKKAQWVTVGRIAITRSTNHRIRDVSIFQRQGVRDDA